MIAGLIEAMRASQYPATVRVVWQCYENHVNEARCWSGTDAEVAEELGFSVDTVSRANAVLERDRIARFVRHKRRRTTVRMLRTYPDGCPKRPRHEPEVARRIEAEIEPELTLQDADSSAELSPQKPETKNPPEKNPPEEGRESARWRAAASPSVQNLPVKEGSQPPDPQGHPLPDDWAPAAADVASALGRGLDPEAETLAFAAYYRSRAHDRAKGWRADWDAAFRSWCCLPWRRRRDAHSQRRRASKPNPGASARAFLAAGFGFEVEAGQGFAPGRGFAP